MIKNSFQVLFSENFYAFSRKDSTVDIITLFAPLFSVFFFMFDSSFEGALFESMRVQLFSSPQQQHARISRWRS